MAKRFTDTEKYKKKFIRCLPGAYKLLWDYLYHDCDFSGIWHVDFEVAQIYLGKDMPVNHEEALRLFNADEERIIVLNGGSKWFIKSFIVFQYGLPLNKNNRLHASVLSRLRNNMGLIKGLVSSLQGAKDKDKDKNKDKDKDIKGGVGGKQRHGERVLLTSQEHQNLITKFGEAGAKERIEKLDLYICSKGDKYKSHYHTILSWAQKDEKTGKPMPVETEYDRKLRELNAKKEKQNVT